MGRSDFHAHQLLTQMSWNKGEGQIVTLPNRKINGGCQHGSKRVCRCSGDILGGKDSFHLLLKGPLGKHFLHTCGHF